MASFHLLYGPTIVILPGLLRRMTGPVQVSGCRRHRRRITALLHRGARGDVRHCPSPFTACKNWFLLNLDNESLLQPAKQAVNHCASLNSLRLSPKLNLFGELIFEVAKSSILAKNPALGPLKLPFNNLRPWAFLSSRYSRWTRSSFIVVTEASCSMRRYCL